MNNKHKNRGFTIIEAMIALVVLSLGLLALGQFQGQLLKSSGETKAQSEGLLIAQQKIEELRNVTVLSELIQGNAADGFTNGTLLASASEADFAGANTLYDIAWTIDKQPIDEGSSLSVRIKVQTSWQDRDDNTQDVVLYSYVAWDDLEISAQEGDGSSSTNTTGNIIPQAAGSGELVGIDILDGDDDGNIDTGWTPITSNEDASLPDAAIVYIQGNDKVVTFGGQEVLYVSNNDIIRVDGTVTIGPDAPNTLTLNDIRTLTSDAGNCVYLNTDADTGVPISGEYACFVASDWFGNVGVLAEEDVNGNPLLCSARIGYVTNCQVLQAINNSTDPVGGNFNSPVVLSTVADTMINGNTIQTCDYENAPPVSGVIGTLPGQDFELNAGGCDVVYGNSIVVDVDIINAGGGWTYETTISINGQLCTSAGINNFTCAVSDPPDADVFRVVTVTKTKNNQTDVPQTCTGIGVDIAFADLVFAGDYVMTAGISACSAL